MKLRLYIGALAVLLPTLFIASCTPSNSAPPPRPEAAYSLDQAIADSRTAQKKVLVAVYAPWCPYCKRMDREVYADTSVQAKLNQYFQVVRVNAEDDSTQIRFQGYAYTQKTLAHGMGVTGYPTTIFFDADGKMLTRVPGLVGKEEFLQILNFIGQDAYRSGSFEDFLKKVS